MKPDRTRYLQKLGNAALLVALLCLSVLRSSPSVAMEISLIQNKRGAPVLFLEGRIYKEDSAAIIARLRKRDFREVWLNSPGGSVAAGYEIGRELRRLGIATRISSSSVCASACVDAFLGGVIRFADPGARILIHPGSVSGEENAQFLLQQQVKQGKSEEAIQMFEQLAAADTVAWTRYLTLMGISQDLVIFAAKVPHRCTITLRQEEMIYFNVVNTAGAPKNGYRPAKPLVGKC